MPLEIISHRHFRGLSARRERFKNYSKDHCWQYEIRLQNLEDDLKAIGLSKNEMEKLSVDDFQFSYVDKEDKKQCEEIKDFIKKHEWLGNIPNRPTHRFTARLKQNSALAGVVIMATPNAFSHLLGKENRDLEKLVARGASISWAPKNLGSWIVSQISKVDGKKHRLPHLYSLFRPRSKRTWNHLPSNELDLLGSNKRNSKTIS